MSIARIEAFDLDVGFQSQTLQTTRVAAPMSRWPEYAEARSSWMWPSRKTFVRVTDQDGLEGWSCTNGGEVTALIVNAHFSRLLEGLPEDEIEDLWDRMVASLLPVDRSGLAMMAVAAIDIALWDLRAKLRSQPLVSLLADQPPHTWLPAYVTTAEPEARAADPWWGLKAAMPYGPADGDGGLEENVALVRRFRKAAGEMRPVMVDAFMAWDAAYTIAFAQACGDDVPLWIEDPLPPYDRRGLKTVRAALPEGCQLALGNFCFHRWDCEALIDDGLVDVLQPDVAWAGGITEGKRILALAAEADVPVMLHNTAEQPWSLALAAACQRDPVVEWVDRGPSSRLAGLMGEPPLVADGEIAVPNHVSGNRPPADIVDRIAPPGGAVALLDNQEPITGGSLNPK